MRAVEKFYSVAEVALLLGFCTKTVTKKLKAGDFGSEVVNLGSEQQPDYRAPASGVNSYLEARRIFLEPEPGVAARSVGELRRKVAKLE